MSGIHADRGLAGRGLQLYDNAVSKKMNVDVISTFFCLSDWIYLKITVR